MNLSLKVIYEVYHILTIPLYSRLKIPKQQVIFKDNNERKTIKRLLQLQQRSYILFLDLLAITFCI